MDTSKDQFTFNSRFCEEHDTEFIEIDITEVEYPFHCPNCGAKLADSIEEARQMPRHVCGRPIN